MKLTLFDTNELLCKAWRQVFADVENVEVICCELHMLPAHDALVSPGNSFGVMTGGIDLAVRDFFGLGVQDVIQNELMKLYAHGLPVGSAITLSIEPAPHEADNRNFKKLIYAPTMERPRKAQRLDVLYATIAALNACEASWSVAIPGMGTGVGEMPHAEAARVMRIGYETHQALTLVV